MTQTELTLLDALFTRGVVTVVPNTINHKTARKLCKMFGLIERETVVADGDQVVYQYRIDTAGFSPAVFNNGTY